MAQYYLMAQLPSLDAVGESGPLPITEERFYELCDRFLGKRASSALYKITLSPPRTKKKSGNTLIDAFHDGERNLRLALGCVRAKKMKKDFDAELGEIPAEYLQNARTAAELKDPLASERFLNKCRLELLESLRPADPFGESSVFYYALKLKLLLRVRKFDEEAGRSAYRNIYASVLNGSEQEAEQ